MTRNRKLKKSTSAVKNKIRKNKNIKSYGRGLSVGSVAFRVLVYFADLTFIPLQALEMAAFHPQDFYKLGKRGINPWAVSDFLQKRQLQQAIRQLRQRKYLVSSKDGFLALSPKARKEIIRYRMMNKEKDKWDGRLRIIIFDVMEARRGERDFLRDLLKEVGCKQLQKSVWITPWDIENELREFLKLTRDHLNGDIRFAVIDKITGQDDILRQFGLST